MKRGTSQKPRETDSVSASKTKVPLAAASGAEPTRPCADAPDPPVADDAQRDKTAELELEPSRCSNCKHNNSICFSRCRRSFKQTRCQENPAGPKQSQGGNLLLMREWRSSGRQGGRGLLSR